jgi:hypothetical protein
VTGRERLGEQPAQRAFELDAARDDVPLAADGTAFGLELVILDATTLDLFNCPKLPAEFGVPEGGRHPKLRMVALLQAGTMRWKAATTAGTPSPTRSKAPSARASSASPTAASSPRTAGCASPRPARTLSRS